MDELEYLVLDANVFISAIKKSEEYSEDCGDILRDVWQKYYLIEPRIVILELVNSIARHLGEDVGKKAYKDLLDAIYLFQDYTTSEELNRVVKLGADYNLYAIDSLYMATALDNNATLVSLDEEDFIDRIKTKDPSFKVFHVSEFKNAGSNEKGESKK